MPYLAFFFVDVHNNYISVDGNIGTKYTSEMLIFFLRYSKFVGIGSENDLLSTKISLKHK